MLSKLSRRRGLQLEALGSVLISTVMLADRFLFTLRVVKRADEQAQNGDQAPE